MDTYVKDGCYVFVARHEATFDFMHKMRASGIHDASMIHALNSPLIGMDNTIYAFVKQVDIFRDFALVYFSPTQTIELLVEAMKQQQNQTSVCGIADTGRNKARMWFTIGTREECHFKYVSFDGEHEPTHRCVPCTSVSIDGRILEDVSAVECHDGVVFISEKPTDIDALHMVYTTLSFSRDGMSVKMSTK